jgi:arsenite-transporting ATPase
MAADGAAWLDRLAPRGARLLLFAGKGGSGKTTCAAAAALALAARHPRLRILLLSTDPAHSLADVLQARAPRGLARPTRLPGVAGQLRVQELDANAAFAARRAHYREAVDAVFAALRGGSRFDLAFDRAVVRDLMELSPTGLDELFGLLALVDALLPGPGRRPHYDVVVLDSAPTGHMLRLLELPAGALAWVHTLLAMLLKYRTIIGLGTLGSDLVDIARRLKALQALLNDPDRTRLAVVSRCAEVVQLETQRLLAGVRRLGLPPVAVIANALTPPGCRRCRTANRTARLRYHQSPGGGAAAPRSGGAGSLARPVGARR